MTKQHYNQDDDTFFKPKKPNSDLDKKRKKNSKVLHELKLVDYNDPVELEKLLDIYDN